MIKKNLIALSLSALASFLTQAQALETGAKAPACLMQNFTDDKPLDLAAYSGKVVYLDFWASWCGPCLQSMPFMDEVQAQLGPRGLQVVAINLDENHADAQQFLDNHPVNIHVVTTQDDSCPNKYGVQAMPSSFLIDRKGNVRYIQTGFRKGETSEIRERLEKLLSEG